VYNTNVGSSLQSFVCQLQQVVDVTDQTGTVVSRSWNLTCILSVGSVVSCNTVLLALRVRDHTLHTAVTMTYCDIYASDAVWELVAVLFVAYFFVQLLILAVVSSIRNVFVSDVALFILMLVVYDAALVVWSRWYSSSAVWLCVSRHDA